MADGSKTEKATPKKRRDERKKGNVFLSQDAVSVATLLTSACLLIAMADGIAARLGEFIVFCVRSCARPTGTAADAAGGDGSVRHRRDLRPDKAPCQR